MVCCFYFFCNMGSGILQVFCNTTQSFKIRKLDKIVNDIHVGATIMVDHSYYMLGLCVSCGSGPYL